MKFLVAFALAVACVHADVSHVVHPGVDASASVVKNVVEVQPESFNYAYETSNGISAQAAGVVKNFNSESAAQEVQGQFKYTGPDNVVYQITYTADENGYQPQGAHLPVPPSVPEAIERSLAYNAAHPQADEKYAPARAVAPVAAVAKAVYNKPASTPFRRF